jgi:hypothetical protein
MIKDAAQRKHAMTDRLGRLLLVTLEAARSNANLPVLAALTLFGGSTPGVVSAPSMAAWA